LKFILKNIKILGEFQVRLWSLFSAHICQTTENIFRGEIAFTFFIVFMKVWSIQLQVYIYKNVLL